jgi:hypothetical protein
MEADDEFEMGGIRGNCDEIFVQDFSFINEEVTKQSQEF